jgi:SAM-dependent methyltransferase
VTSPDYSPFARQYAASRPRYPPELFARLASLVDQHRLAWDSATGNGQAALDLAGYFARVVATDISEEQIRHAAKHPRIEYRVARSEESGLAEGTVDLVTVASAVHWFNLGNFFSEVRRVVRPGGVLAAWTYHVGCVEPPFDQVFKRLYRDTLSPYFAGGARLVDDRYETIALPGEAIDPGEFRMSALWNLDQMISFIGSWSGTQRYVAEKGRDPVTLIAEELEHLWGERKRVHTVRWPLFLRISRI